MAGRKRRRNSGPNSTPKTSTSKPTGRVALPPPNAESSNAETPSSNDPEKQSFIDKLIEILKKISKKKKKNISTKYPVGRTLKTQDKYLPIDRRGVSDNPKNSRYVVIIDTNKKDELAIVRLTTRNQKNTTELNSYRKGNFNKTYFKHFIEISDNENKPIKVDGEKFNQNSANFDLSKEEIDTIRQKVLYKCRQAQNNRSQIAKLKDNGDKK